MTHYRWHVGSVSIILKRQLPCSSGLREKVFSSEQFKPQLPYYLSLSFPNQRNLMVSRSHILQVSQGFGLFALGLFGLKFWLHENAKKNCGGKKTKKYEKRRKPTFARFFLVLLWLGFCTDVFGFACPLFAMVCEPQFQTLSISAFENAIFWNNHTAVRSRFILPCKSDCLTIFLKKQGTYSLYAKLWLERPLIKNINDSYHQNLSNITFGASLAFQMREEYVFEKNIFKNWTSRGVNSGVTQFYIV